MISNHYARVHQMMQLFGQKTPDECVGFPEV